MVLDATQHHAQPLTAERLFGWHAAIFPTGYSGRVRIKVGAWRNDAADPMQVVSGPAGRDRVHYEAPPAAALPAETATFLHWFNAAPAGDALIHAGLAHLWLVTLHPFDDGNGRISRAVGDMALARAEGTAQRFYSLSAQIQRERKQYYDQLETTQRGTLDVTSWLHWFLACLLRAVQGADGLLAGVLDKAQFWQRWAGTPMNHRQTLVLNRLLDRAPDGMAAAKLTNTKWAAIGKCSADTALRDINDLVARGVLRRLESGGAEYWVCGGPVIQRSTGFNCQWSRCPEPALIAHSVCLTGVGHERSDGQMEGSRSTFELSGPRRVDALKAALKVAATAA